MRVSVTLKILDEQLQHRASPLSANQTQMLLLSCSGATDKEIARTLGITGAAVKARKRDLRVKLGGKNMIHAAVIAAKRGLV